MTKKTEQYILVRFRTYGLDYEYVCDMPSIDVRPGDVVLCPAPEWKEDNDPIEGVVVGVRTFPLWTGPWKKILGKKIVEEAPF